MALLTVQRIGVTGGIAPTLVAATAGGDTFGNTGREFVQIHNGDATSHTLTIAAQQTCNLGVLHPIAIAVAAGVTRQAGPFSTQYYADTSGVTHMTYDAVTAVTIGAFGAF